MSHDNSLTTATVWRMANRFCDVPITCVIATVIENNERLRSERYPSRELVPTLLEWLVVDELADCQSRLAPTRPCGNRSTTCPQRIRDLLRRSEPPARS